ncbi:MAG: histidinol-phosphate aminotransferase family protein [Phycisphaerae bacterium]|nr:histidinol-phosphate aminotransferase family protein [Phycisphaerae bacterium]
MSSTLVSKIEPSPAVRDIPAYQPPARSQTVDLYLDSNEGATPRADLLAEIVGLDANTLRSYPRKQPMEALLAQRLGVRPEQVVVTAGGDEALDRSCRAVLGPGRDLIMPVPSFEMIERYARLLRAEVRTVPWTSGPYPTEAVLEAVGPRTGAIAVVSPNNPTGAVASADDLRELSAAAPQALLIVDLAYGEFADEDLTLTALSLPNAVVIRTLSKAWGLAGLRVGYAVGPEAIINWLRAAGGPYPVSALSLAVAQRQLVVGDAALRCFVETIRSERSALSELLQSRGAAPLPSQGNFVLVRLGDASRIKNELLARGISVRDFATNPDLAAHLRITLPGDAVAFSRLNAALEQISTTCPAAFRAAGKEQP